jgi:uncharacterized membrane protein
VQLNVGTVERIGSVAAGAALLYFAHRPGRTGSPSGTRRWLRGTVTRSLRQAGTGLVVRGLVGYCPVNALMGRDTHSRESKIALGGVRGIHVLESIVVPVPPAAAYRFWRNLANLPRFMSHLDRVDVIDATHSHWVAAGPAGLQATWDAKIINDIENRLIGWKSLDCADVVSAGSVRFRATAGGTEITVHLQYEPPGGRLGNWIAEAFGESPARAIRDDLQRLKHQLAPARQEIEAPGFWSAGQQLA